MTTIRTHSPHHKLPAHVLTGVACAGLLAACTSVSAPAAASVLHPATSSPPTPAASPTLDPATSPAPTSRFELVLPDLKTLPPSDLLVRLNPVTGRRILRFTNSIVNVGPGVIEISGTTDSTAGTTSVVQHLYGLDGIERKVPVGEFFFHAEHGHWHFDDFARYELWSLTRDAELDRVLAFTDKVGYCLRDDLRLQIAGSARQPVYTGCQRNLQGITPGWVDVYYYHLEGQSLEITRVPDGLHALRSVVDPNQRLRERDHSNNEVVVFLEIRGDSVRSVSEAEARLQLAGAPE